MFARPFWDGALRPLRKELAVKVIKAPSPVWSFKFTCSFCGAECEAEIEDVKQGEFGGGYCERGETRYYVECPFCGKCQFPKDSRERLAFVIKRHHETKGE